MESGGNLRVALGPKPNSTHTYRHPITKQEKRKDHDIKLLSKPLCSLWGKNEAECGLRTHIEAGRGE